MKLPDEPVWLYVSRLVAGFEDADAEEADDSDEGEDDDDDGVDELKYLRSAIVDEFIYVTFVNVLPQLQFLMLEVSLICDD